MSDRIDNLLEQLVRTVIARVPDALAVYLFGTYGTAAGRADSDIDLAVLAERPLEPVTRFDLAGELATTAGRDVDLVDLATASTVLRAQVVSSGERLFCSDERRCEHFEDAAFSRYAYLNEERAAILRDVRARGSIHG